MSCAGWLGPLFIFLCCFMDFEKNGTSNWKITKFSANTFEHSEKLQSKLQWRSFFCSWVIGLYFLCIYYILCSFTEFYKNETSNWKSTTLWGSHYQYLNSPQPKSACLSHFGSWVTRLNVSMYKYKFYNYMVFDER